jgi:hypothetical protein
MNGTIEEFNKGFDKRFWQKEQFTDLNDIRKKSVIFFEKFSFEIDEKVHNRKDSIFKSGS